MRIDGVFLGNVLSDDTLRQLVPAAFSTTHSDNMSEKYKHLTTMDVVNILRDNDFVPVYAFQSSRNTIASEDHKKHMIRFRHKEYLDEKMGIVGDVTPELVLVNSHDGSTAYQFYLGIYRIAGQNQLVTQSEDIGNISVRHSGRLELLDRIAKVSDAIIERVPMVMEKVNHWKEINLTRDQQEEFVALASKIKPNKNIDVLDLLRAHRPEDEKKNDLFTVYNRIQENMIKGGIQGNKNGRQTRTRTITNVTENLRINKELWSLTHEMASVYGK